MKTLLVLSLISISFAGSAQQYNVALLPDSLRENANAVKRLEEIKVTIKSPGRALVRRKYAITILNEAGEDHNTYFNTYDKFESLFDITGTLYDAYGKELKSVKKKDLEDRAYTSEVSLVEDSRYKAHNFYYKLYPYTIEYEDEKEIEGLFYLPSWTPVDDYKFSVQLSRFTVEVPAGYRLRYKQLNYAGVPQLTEGKTKLYTWELKNLKAIEQEPLSPSPEMFQPMVFLGPSDFEIAGYKGNMESWESLGKFISTLNAGRDALPDNIKADVHQLTDGLASVHDKVKALYEYLQKNTRYISIQLGIGGWQPFDAKYVAT